MADPTISKPDLEAIKARFQALESSEEYGQGRLNVAQWRTSSGHYGIWYDDGDLLAEVHDNLGLGMSGEAYANFFAACLKDIPTLVAEIQRLEAELAALNQN